MQGLRRRCSNDVLHLDLTLPAAAPAATPTPTTPTGANPTTMTSSSLSIDAGETTETKIQRLISEHPVIIFSKSSCYMCHVMKKLLATVGVHPTVIELEEHEISALPPPPSSSSAVSPAVFIGGTCVGGLESLVALHLSGLLVPKLEEVGAFWV